jgi:hypothetical protein
MKLTLLSLLLTTTFLLSTTADEESRFLHPKLFYAEDETLGIRGRFICVMNQEQNAAEIANELLAQANDTDMVMGRVFEDSLKGFVLDIKARDVDWEQLDRLVWRERIYNKLIAWLNGTELEFIEQVRAWLKVLRRC